MFDFNLFVGMVTLFMSNFRLMRKPWVPDAVKEQGYKMMLETCREMVKQLEKKCGVPVDMNLTDTEQWYALAGNSSDKIQAIKQFRSRTGCGLREAKEAVEKWQRDNNVPVPTYN